MLRQYYKGDSSSDRVKTCSRKKSSLRLKISSKICSWTRHIPQYKPSLHTKSAPSSGPHLCLDFPVIRSFSSACYSTLVTSVASSVDLCLEPYSTCRGDSHRPPFSPTPSVSSTDRGNTEQYQAICLQNTSCMSELNAVSSFKDCPRWSDKNYFSHMIQSQMRELDLSTYIPMYRSFCQQDAI